MTNLMTVNRPDTERVIIKREDVEVQVTIFEKEPHEGFVRIWNGDGTIPRTYPIKVI
jgi:hypothetical protein